MKLRIMKKAIQRNLDWMLIFAIVQIVAYLGVIIYVVIKLI